MSAQFVTEKKSETSFSNRLTSFSRTCQPETKTALFLKSLQSGDEQKKMRRQYEYKILQLQNELNFARQEITYKQEVHERQLLNLKAFMQYQYTTKTRQLKQQLRQQYGNCLVQCTAAKEKNKLMEDQIRLMKMKFQRSEKYGKQVEKMSQQKLAKQCQGFEEKIKVLETNLNRLKKSMTKQHQQQLKQVTITAQREKKQLEQKIKLITEQNERLKIQVSTLKEQLKKQILQRQEVRIQKQRNDVIIKEQQARIQILRENPVIQGAAAKKQQRQARLRELDQNIMSSFENQDRKLCNTMDLYRGDLQRQIFLEKEMKKRWQTQGPTQSQIKRIVNVKHNGSYESSKLQKKRQESPRFGYKS